MNIEEIALKMAPSFRERFDFTDEKQYDAWLDMTFTAAEKFYKKTDAWKTMLANAAKEHAEVQARIAAKLAKEKEGA